MEQALMSDIRESLKNAISSATDALEMYNFNQGFEAAINALDELSNYYYNNGNKTRGEELRWAVKELLGENDAD
jgi:soluble cytochrome b562